MPNSGRKYPAEVLTTSEVAAILGAVLAAGADRIRNRAILTLL